LFQKQKVEEHEEQKKEDAERKEREIDKTYVGRYWLNEEMNECCKNGGYFARGPMGAHEEGGEYDPKSYCETIAVTVQATGNFKLFIEGEVVSSSKWVYHVSACTPLLLFKCMIQSSNRRPEDVTLFMGEQEINLQNRPVLLQTCL
jgi:hypothetical protein